MGIRLSTLSAAFLSTVAMITAYAAAAQSTPPAQPPKMFDRLNVMNSGGTSVGTPEQIVTMRLAYALANSPEPAPR